MPEDHGVPPNTDPLPTSIHDPGKSSSGWDLKRLATTFIVPLVGVMAGAFAVLAYLDGVAKTRVETAVVQAIDDSSVLGHLRQQIELIRSDTVANTHQVAANESGLTRTHSSIENLNSEFANEMAKVHTAVEALRPMVAQAIAQIGMTEHNISQLNQKTKAIDELDHEIRRLSSEVGSLHSSLPNKIQALVRAELRSPLDELEAVEGEIRENTERISEQLARLEGRVTYLDRDVRLLLQEAIHRAAALSDKEVQARREYVENLLARAKERGVFLTASDIESITEKLIEPKPTPERNGPRRREGYLRVKVSPWNAGVYIDGNYVGTAAMYGSKAKTLPLKPGQYELRFIDPRYETLIVPIQIDKGKTTTIRRAMNAIDRNVEGPFGELETKGFANAAVYLNGAYYGNTRELSTAGQQLLIKAGTYTLKIVPVDGGTPREAKITINADETLVISKTGAPIRRK